MTNPMERILAFFRAQPVLMGIALFITIAAGVLILIGTQMNRAGLSLKPLVFFGVFLGIIAGPQIVFQLLRARGIAPDLTWTPDDRQSQATANESVLGHTGGKFDHPETVFGDGFDRDLVSDVTRLFAAHDPLVAQMAIFRTAETAIVARFPNPEKAGEALRNYSAMLGLPQLPRAASDGSFTLTRGADMARLLAAGDTLFIWTAATNAGLDQRMTASRAAWQLASAPPRDPRVILWWKIMTATVPVLLIAASLWFFKGSSWAATITPSQRPAIPVTSSELRSRLLEIENLKQPVKVLPGEKPNEVIVTWRADAAWLDLARVRGLRRTHKLVLQLDDASRDARVTEYSSQLDWSAGTGGASAQWRTQSGIVFFQSESQQVYGLQIDPGTGRFKPALSYTYTLNLQELKAPLISAITRAGWTWKPVIWQSPAWLRWATE